MIRLLLVAGVLVPGLALAASNRFAAFLLYVWFACYRPQESAGVDISFLRLSLVLSLLVVVPWRWLASRSARESGHDEPVLPNLAHPLSAGTLAFLALALLAQTWAFRPAVSWAQIDSMWRVQLVALVGVALIGTARQAMLVMVVMGGSIGLHAVVKTVAAVGSGAAIITDGIGGGLGDNNGLALAIVTTLPLLVAAAQNLSGRLARLAVWSLLPFGLAATVLTFSRGGFLALAVAGLALILLQRRRVPSLIVAASLVAAAGFVLPGQYTERLKTIQTFNVVGEQSAISRLHFWRVALEMVREHPFGVGVGNYEEAYSTYDTSGGRYGSRRAVHSVEMQVLAELGYPGAALYAGLFGCAFALAFRGRARARREVLAPEMQKFLLTASNALIVSMAGFLAGGAFLAAAYGDLVWLTFCLVAAVDRIGTRALAEAGTDSRAETPSAAASRAATFVPRHFRGARAVESGTS